MLDIFFEALNYEKIEQKKAYEIAGLLGELSLFIPDVYVSPEFGKNVTLFYNLNRLIICSEPNQLL